MSVSQSSQKGGRPTVMSEETLRKLQYAVADGATIEEACLIAEIGVSTYYDYIKENPEFSEFLKGLKSINSVYANRRLRRALDELPLKEAIDLAFSILNEEWKKEERHRRYVSRKSA